MQEIDNQRLEELLQAVSNKLDENEAYLGLLEKDVSKIRERKQKMQNRALARLRSLSDPEEDDPRLERRCPSRGRNRSLSLSPRIVPVITQKRRPENLALRNTYDCHAAMDEVFRRKRRPENMDFTRSMANQVQTLI